MAKSASAALAFALVSLVAAGAHAADKLRLERMDAKGMPDIKLHLTYVDSDGRAITGRAKEDFKIVIDSAEQGTAKTAQGFEETKDPINVVVVVQLGSAMNSVLEDVKRGVVALADSLPP